MDLILLCSSDVQWEGDCHNVEATFQQFVDWLEGKDEDSVGVNPLRSYDVTSHWCYLDYKYMKSLFADHPDLLQVGE